MDEGDVSSVSDGADELEERRLWDGLDPRDESSYGSNRIGGGEESGEDVNGKKGSSVSEDEESDEWVGGDGTLCVFAVRREEFRKLSGGSR